LQFAPANAKAKICKRVCLCQRYKPDRKENSSVQQWLKNIGILVVNWKFRASIENRQTKILIVKKEKE
jgi:hypothetical protein